MASLALAARIVVAVALIVAGVQKLRVGRSLRPQVAAFGVPAGIAPVVAVTLPVVEFVTGLSLLVFVRSSLPAWVALGLLALFTGAVAANLASGRRVPCPCFGTSMSDVSPGSLVRNSWLVALAVVGTGSITGATATSVIIWTVLLGLATLVALRLS